MSVPEDKQLRITIVDDDPATLRLVGRIISSAGYDVNAVDNGREALAGIRKDCPDILICDWDMPDINGLEVCKTIRREHLPQHLYVILLTANTKPQQMVEGLDAGADDFVGKPVLPAVLLARIKAAGRLVAVEKELRLACQIDPLTELPNRRTFREKLDQAWTYSMRYHQPISSVMIDLDFFKHINDRYGHAGGDQTLKAVAKVLKAHVRSTDFLCRFGGEEFCAVLPGSDEADAAAWAERLRGELSEMTISLDDDEVQVTASIGVAGRLESTPNAESLVRQADRALAAAKQSGRDCVICFNIHNNPATGTGDMGNAKGPLKGILARNVMTEATYCPNRVDSIKHACDSLLQLRLSSAPVIDDAGLLVGLVSVTDLMTFTATGKGWEQCVDKVMKPDVVCYDESAPAFSIFEFLARASIRRIVVVRKGRPVGTISRAGLLRWLRNWISVDCHDPDGEHPLFSAATKGDHIAEVTTISESIARLESRLTEQITDPTTDFVPCVIGEATRLQELANDLLAQCQSEPMSMDSSEPSEPGHTGLDNRKTTLEKSP